MGDAAPLGQAAYRGRIDRAGNCGIDEGWQRSCKLRQHLRRASGARRRASREPAKSRGRFGAAGKPTTNAAATATAQFEGLAADAKQKGIYADAAVETEAELKAKKAKGIPLSTTEELRLKELRIQEAQAIIQESIAVSAKQWAAGMAEITAPDSLASQGERMLSELAGSKPSRAR